MIEVVSLSKNYPRTKAVDNVSFTIAKGETLGLVGESGCGKTTLGRMLLRLILPSAGQIFFEQEEITFTKSKKLCRDLQVIFQDPYASLNPRMTAGSIIEEPLKIHKINRSIDELLALVGLPPSAKERYPHEFSGGQRQRIGIARALALSPKFIVCDEPISALDVSIQAQILNLLVRLQKELGLSLLFISHDLSAVKYISDRIAVMYRGQFVEVGPSDTLCKNPLHPYTNLLLSSVPTLDKKPHPLPLAIESEETHLSGCPFYNRCPRKTDLCKQKRPDLKEIEPNHFTACHFPLKIRKIATKSENVLIELDELSR